MNLFDYAVLFISILAIALYGILRTRGRKNLHDYLRGNKKQSGFIIGLSVMATQASAITFLSMPGQGYAGGLSFIQNYFAMPLALVIISALFLPLYRKLNVYTAYQFLGARFDTKTRLLTAALFLLQRGMGAGITIYAPAIVLSTVFGWSLPLTIIASSLVVIIYTVVGGSDAVTHTQKYQMAVIFAGMIAAFVILLQKIPCSFPDALAIAGHFGKLNAVSFSTNPKERYTVWTGMLGGLFLMLSYFGADQSKVQRYIAGDNLRESRLGLMFNALFKIPMQFAILLLGVMLFVFYHFQPTPPPNSNPDYIFINFIIYNLPHGLIGLLVAAFFAAALSSKAAELNALASTSVIDFYRAVIRPHASDRHYVLASKAFTIFWGLIAMSFALFAHMSENLIQAANIVGSLFYGVILALFLIAFFLKPIRGTAAFSAALIAETAVLIMFATLNISYLWYNLIGCTACILLAITLQPFFPTPPRGFEPILEPNAPPP